MKNIVNVLWTGGLDSTCRIAELSKRDVIVQPYYIIDPLRSSIKEKLKAIRTISEIARKKKNTFCELREVLVFEMDMIKPDSEITQAWLVFRKKYMLGSH